MMFKELDDVKYTKEFIPATVVNVLYDDEGNVGQYWLELHEVDDEHPDKVVFAEPSDVFDWESGGDG